MSVFNKFRKDIFIIFLMFIRSNEWRRMEATKEKMCVVEAAKKRGALLMGTRSCGFIAWVLPTMGPTKVVAMHGHFRRRGDDLHFFQ